MDNELPTARHHLIALFFVLAAGFAGYLAAPDFFLAVWRLISSSDAESAAEFLNSFGPAASVVSFLVLVIINAVGVLPNFFFLAANGIIFGVVNGTLLSWTGEVVGSVIGFAFLRYLFRDYAEQFVKNCGALHHIEVLGGRSGLKVILLARAIPYMPSGLVTALSAVSNVSFRDYTIATAIGKLPSVWLEVTLGHDLVSYKDHLLRLTVLILVSVAAFSVVWWYRHKERCRS